MTVTKSVLEGLRVLDFAWVLAVPLATRYLADYGAEVIRIESVAHPDLGRLTSPFKDDVPGLDRSMLFGYGNSSKKSMCVDLRQSRGMEIVKRLVSCADVVTESYAPGTMGKWGLSYEELAEIKPDIIMVSGSVFGQTGLYRSHPGFGWNLNAFCGFNDLTGWPDREPSGPNLAYSDFIAPWFCIVAILAALHYRGRTGEGQYIDLSQFEASLQFLAPALLDCVVNGRQAIRNGNRCAYSAPHGIYHCNGDDTWCAIAVSDDRQWGAFCQVMGDPEWTKRPEFSTLSRRLKHQDELDALISEWTSQHTAKEVMERMQAVGIPSGMVQSAQDLCSDPQLASREHFRIVDHPETGPFPHAGWAAKISGSPYKIKRAPLMGEHTRRICTEMLHMSEQEYAALVSEGVLR